MQFNAVAILAVLASVVAAGQPEAVTVTVYNCETSVAPPVPTSTPVETPVFPTATGVGSTGIPTAPQPTTSPIFNSGAAVNGASALGMIIAGGVALLL